MNSHFPDFEHNIYNNKSFVIPTKHKKSEALLDHFKKILGVDIVEYYCDTDKLGTFSGEIERKGTAKEVAKEKCLIAIKENAADYIISSEGSFGPNPHNPFIAVNHEILFFMDTVNNFELIVEDFYSETNFSLETISSLAELKIFSDKVLFPAHGIILKSNNIIIKDILCYKDLETKFRYLIEQSKDGKVIVETDMRAHMNPTRMSNIKRLGFKLAQRLAEHCPDCKTPGFGKVDVEVGLQCELCNSETSLVKNEVYGCVKCDFIKKNSRADNLSKAPPEYCNYCNP